MNSMTKNILKIALIILLFGLKITEVAAQTETYENKMGIVEGIRRNLCLNGWLNTACSSTSDDILKCAKEHTAEQAQRICQYELGLLRRKIEWNARGNAESAGSEAEQKYQRRIFQMDEDAKKRSPRPSESIAPLVTGQRKSNFDQPKLNVTTNNKLTSEEAQGLENSIRTGLNSDLYPIVPMFLTTEARLYYLRWLDSITEKFKDINPDLISRTEFLQTVWYESRRAGLEPSLILGLIASTSNFRKFYTNEAGASGFMGVMPHWTKLIGDGDTTKLFHLQTNLRYGCVLLRHYLDKRTGNLQLALDDYAESNHLLITEKNQPASKFSVGVFKNELFWR